MLFDNSTLPAVKKDAALWYIGQGIRVLPLWWTDEHGNCACPKGAACPSPGKHPIGELVPNGFKDASNDPETIEGWWDRYPNANIGAPTGSVNGFDVLDIDPRSGGGRSWQELKDAHPELRAIKTTYVKTPGGGIHHYFRHVEGLKNSSSKLAPGIDVKTDGGYVLVPPSVIGGKPYEWRRA